MLSQRSVKPIREPSNRPLWDYKLTILRPLYTDTGTEQLSKWVLDSACQIPHCWSGVIDKKGEETKIIKMIMQQS